MANQTAVVQVWHQHQWLIGQESAWLSNHLSSQWQWATHTGKCTGSIYCHVLPACLLKGPVLINHNSSVDSGVTVHGNPYVTCNIVPAARQRMSILFRFFFNLCNTDVHKHALAATVRSNLHKVWSPCLITKVAHWKVWNKPLQRELCLFQS